MAEDDGESFAVPGTSEADEQSGHDRAENENQLP
jgi:hypothetical protein